MRGALTAAGVALALTLTTGGCVAGSPQTPTPPARSTANPNGSSTVPTPGPSDTCAPAGQSVELGSDTFDKDPSTRVRTPAGWYLVSATGFEHGGLFDPPEGRTLVAWGPADRVPTYDPGPATVRGASGTFEVVEGKGTWVQLPEGDHWFLNSNGADLGIAGCGNGIPLLQ